MKIPQKILEIINAEAIKNARFNWYQGWERSSGYIKSELSTDVRYGTVRIYIKWEKKKPPTQAQIEQKIKEHILELCNNQQHHSEQRDFRHYVTDRFYIDVTRLKHEAMLSILDKLPRLIKIIEDSDDFFDKGIQNLHNDLKNLECGIDDVNALEKFLDSGKKRIGE
jgi:hypothetical protein